MCAKVSEQVFLGMPAVIASAAMRRLLETVERLAPTQAAVLITGESGTGKELVARALHHYSLRSAKPWVDISCAALPEHLIESELFGYDRGAFSGADSTKPGLFELAHTGTLFLDEIAELEPRLQVKLLRVLDGTPYYRLGGVKKVSVDVRIITATNQDLPEAMRAGRFRADLYHRLNQVRVEVPPLRERAEDVAALAEFFLRQHGEQLQFTSEALECLRRYRWPGNVRELRNAVIAAAALARNQAVSPEDLPAEVRAGVAATEPAADLDGLERHTILRVLAQTGGHHRRAAELLGISTRTLSRKLKAYGMEEAGSGALVQ